MPEIWFDCQQWLFCDMTLNWIKVMSISGNVNNANTHHPESSIQKLPTSGTRGLEMGSDVQSFCLYVFLLFFNLKCFSVFFFFFREELQPSCQFSKASCQPQMYCQEALRRYVTYIHWINSELNESEIDISITHTQTNFPQKEQVICGMHVDFSLPHLFLCPVPTCSGCCWEQAAIKWFPWEATESGRE